MNGVLRLLSSATTPAAPDLPVFSQKSGPSWPPTTPPPQSTPNLKKERPKPPATDDSLNHARTLSTQSQHLPNHTSSPSSSSLNRISRKSVNLSEPGWKRNSGPLNTRDELLMSLMASEAVVDSRGFDILTAEEVEDYKKVGNIS